MEAFLIIAFLVMGQVPMNVAVAQKDMESCQKAIEQTMFSQTGGIVTLAADAQCVTRAEFLKMTGQAET